METPRNNAEKTMEATTIRQFISADIEYIISRQISLYEVEYGFTSDAWKAYINEGVNSLINQFSAEKDCLYILEANGKVSGCIAITHIEDDVAQLRFFFIEPHLRGFGAGKRLINMAVDFCRAKKYRLVFLWTFSKLEAARHLYYKKGFRITDTHENRDWGEPVLEERWDLEL